MAESRNLPIDRDARPATRQLRQFKVKVFDAADATTLETDMQAWLALAGEKVYIEGHPLGSFSGSYSFMILYAE